MRHALFLEPLDGWSFRDGKPFEVGQAFEARSLFPPHPWTVLGCLRTALLRRLCPEPERYADPVRCLGRARPACPACGAGPCLAEPRVGRPGEAAPFAMGPPLLARRLADGGVRVFYPTPRDLVTNTGEDAPEDPEDSERPTFLLEPLTLPAGVRHCAGSLRPVGRAGPERVEAPAERVLARERLEACLAGRPPTPAARGHASDSGSRSGDGPPKVFREPRIGIGMDPGTRAAAEGRFYVRDVVRVEEGTGLVVQTGEDLGLDGETARLGGDGRMARIWRVEPPPPPALPEVGLRLKLYLASPAWFGGSGERGWYPSWLDPGTLAGTEPRSGARLELVGAAVGRLEPAGGWDLARQEPRPIRWLVPAGAVYFFETKDAAAGRAAGMALHGQSIVEDGAMRRAGFGLCFAGRWGHE